MVLPVDGLEPMGRHYALVYRKHLRHGSYLGTFLSSPLRIGGLKKEVSGWGGVFANLLGRGSHVCRFSHPIFLLTWGGAWFEMLIVPRLFPPS